MKIPWTENTAETANERRDEGMDLSEDVPAFQTDETKGLHTTT